MTLWSSDRPALAQCGDEYWMPCWIYAIRPVAAAAAVLFCYCFLLMLPFFAWRCPTHYMAVILNAGHDDVMVFVQGDACGNDLPQATFAAESSPRGQFYLRSNDCIVSCSIIYFFNYVCLLLISYIICILSWFPILFVVYKKWGYLLRIKKKFLLSFFLG